MITARSYQTEAVDSIFRYFTRNFGNPLVAMPTGTGKSVVIALFLHAVFKHYPTQKLIVLTHVKELIQQNYEKLMSMWAFAPAGVYSAGLNRRDLHAPITFAGIGSVAKKAAAFGHVDLLVIDEAHLLSPEDVTMYRVFISALIAINPNLKVIGFTATPWRIGQGRLTDEITNNKGEKVPPLFTDICFDITGIESFNRLIAEGFLAPLIPKSTTTKLEIDGVHMRGGEFIAKELQAAVDKMEITVAAVKEALEQGDTRKHWLVFAAGVEHAIHTADIMNDMGIPTVAIHSKMGNKERDQAIKDFKAGKYRAAVNNNVLTTGFDFPGIDLILCLRPTASAVLWVQMLGRGTRPSPGKENCLVLDFADNTRRLGPINDPVVPRRKGEKGGSAPVKECPCCNTWVHASLRYCNGILDNGQNCTYEFKFETKLKQGASTNELIKGDMPVVEVFKINHITYIQYRKEGRPPMMKASYYCGYRIFEEYVCVEHTNFAAKKARDWWRARSESPVPTTVSEALEAAANIRVPTHLRVWVNKKYPEILATCFDGTAFNTIEPDSAPPTVQSNINAPKEEKIPTFDDFPDEDIPF